MCYLALDQLQCIELSNAFDQVLTTIVGACTINFLYDGVSKIFKSRIDNRLKLDF